MKVDKSEIEEDIKKYKAISAIANQDGGKLLIESLRKDIKRDIDIILSLFDGEELKLRMAVVSLKKNLSLLKVLVGSQANFEMAQEALKSIDE